MSSKRIEDRLDAMLAPLRDCPAELDEIAHARVRARLEAAIADDVSPAEIGRRRGWRIAGIAAALAFGAAAVFAVIAAITAATPARPATAVAVSHPGDSAVATTGANSAVAATSEHSAVAATSEHTAVAATSERSAVADVTASKEVVRSGSIVVPSEASAAPITVAAGESAQLMIAGAAVTVYGPGRLSPTADGAVAEGAGVVVDRTLGDRPWSVRYHGATVVAMHATFALDVGSGPRVTVVRGEIELRCAAGPKRILAGTSGTCPPEVEVAVTPKAPPAVPPRASRSSPEGPRPEDRTRPGRAAVDPYSLAEAALRRGDLDGARGALLAIIDAAPRSLDAATALLDLARLAARRGDTADALGYLERLDRHPRRAALAVAAAHLRGTLPPSPIVHLPPAP